MGESGLGSLGEQPARPVLLADRRRLARERQEFERIAAAIFKVLESA